MHSKRLKETDKPLKLEKQTINFLDCIAALGHFIEVIDAEGYYIYVSSNCTYDSTTAEELVGKHTTEAFNLTHDSSILINTLNSGKPYRNLHLKYKSNKTNKTHHFLYHSFPIISKNTIIGAITLYKHIDEVKRAINYIDTSNTLELINTESIISQKKNELFTFDDIICSSDAMMKTVKLAKRVSKSDSSVLIVGETGTGKELFAQSIHSFYKKKSQPFVAINCAAIPDALLESILFGVTKGSYTDAIDKQGLFEDAQNGTIFLDELQALSIEMQAKILRVLETKSVRRVGGNKDIPVNIRVISAMNTDPLTAIDEGKLKADLFYRIAVITLKITPLRERGLPALKLLTSNFIKHINDKLSTKIKHCSEDTFDVFQHYNFPGNCRELSHIIEHAANMMDEDEFFIEPYHLPYYINEFSTATYPQKRTSLNSELGDDEFKLGDYKAIHQKAVDEFNDKFNTEYLTFALNKCNGNISKVAREINISRQHLHGLISKYNIQV